MQYLDAISQQNDFCLFPRKTTEYHNNQVCAPTSNAKEVEVEWC